MNHATTCKFCHKPITIEIDDGYAVIGDYLKILPLAACNRCADLRVRRRIIEEEIKKSIAPLVTTRIPTSDQKQSSLDRLIPLTKKYTALVADWCGSKIPQWDSSIPEAIIESPNRWTSILSQCWKVHKQPLLT